MPDAEPQPRPVQDPQRKKNLTKDQGVQVVSKMFWWELQNHGVDGKFACRTCRVDFGMPSKCMSKVPDTIPLKSERGEPA